MKIAITYENGTIFQHFGHTEYFKLYTVEDGTIINSEICSADGAGHESLAVWLKAAGADILICGGIGGGAQQALAAAGITLYGSVTGSADEAAQAFAAGQLMYDPHVRCTHHDGQTNHQCGDTEHHCGHHN